MGMDGHGLTARGKCGTGAFPEYECISPQFISFFRNGHAGSVYNDRNSWEPQLVFLLS